MSQLEICMIGFAAFLLLWFLYLNKLCFPYSRSLLCLLWQKEAPPSDHREIWAVQWYRATYAPDCGVTWMPKWIVAISWGFWVFLLLFTLASTLVIYGWVPAQLTRYLPELLTGLLHLVVFSLEALLFLLALEILLWKTKGISPSAYARSEQWLRQHPAPADFQETKPNVEDWRMPVWFWLPQPGRGGSVLRIVFFLGGLWLTVMLALLFSVGAQVNAQYLRTEHFWDLALLWSASIWLLTLPITFSLLHLDWIRKKRSLLLRWAILQQDAFRS